ncbi:hypothetical protein AM587_10001828 [Phytophthora nicotianae]|uniref:Uncharacterized protein n=1 Tax=Phytophthora nicotianae TaxID=4792 RepID=A0A0W8CXE4_PHYNI|nr:hypothetical protein AM587_10001828 [Phytophthora nicotianae]
MGTPLCCALYKLNQNAILIEERDLMRRFRVFFLNSQQRAHDCPQQQKILDAFRTLPLTYPDGSSSSGCQQLNATPDFCLLLAHEAKPGNSTFISRGMSRHLKKHCKKLDHGKSQANQTRSYKL